MSSNTLVPELKAYGSPDLEFGRLPANPEVCEVRLEIAIGIAGDQRADRFYCTAVTPRILMQKQQVTWGRGYLIIPRFTWPTVERALTALVSGCSGPSWNHITMLLNRELVWDYDS